MILGRSPALWLAVIAALLNVAVVVFGVHLSTEQLATLNGAAVALVGVIANESDPTTAGTFATTLTRPAPAAPILPGVPSPSTGAGVPPAGGAGGATPPVDGPPTPGAR